MSAKFGEVTHSGLVSIMFTRLLPNMSILTLTFDLWLLKGVLNNFSHFGSARLFLFIFAYYIKHLLIYDIL